MFGFFKNLIGKGKEEGKAEVQEPVRLTKEDLPKYPDDFTEQDIADAEQFTDKEIDAAQEIVRLSDSGLNYGAGGPRAYDAYYAIGKGYKSGKDVAGIVKTDHIRHLEGQKEAVAVMKSGIKLLKSVAADELGGHKGAEATATNIAHGGASYRTRHVLGQER
jgi:hypothetical protein